MVLDLTRGLRLTDYANNQPRLKHFADVQVELASSDWSLAKWNGNSNGLLDLTRLHLHCLQPLCKLRNHLTFGFGHDEKAKLNTDNLRPVSPFNKTNSGWAPATVAARSLSPKRISVTLLALSVSSWRRSCCCCCQEAHTFAKLSEQNSISKRTSL